MKINVMFLLFYIFAVLTIFVSGCSPILSPSENRGSSPPAISIIIPKDDPHAVGITGYGLCAILVEVSNFKLVDKQGEQNIAGEGHIHFYLDIEPPVEQGKPAITDGRTYYDTSETLYYWPKIGPGVHTFWVQLVNNDHTPLDPPVVVRASVASELWDG